MMPGAEIHDTHDRRLQHGRSIGLVGVSPPFTRSDGARPGYLRLTGQPGKRYSGGSGRAMRDHGAQSSSRTVRSAQTVLSAGVTDHRAAGNDLDAWAIRGVRVGWRNFTPDWRESGSSSRI